MHDMTKTKSLKTELLLTSSGHSLIICDLTCKVIIVQGPPFLQIIQT